MINIGIVGMGAMGKGLLFQALNTPGVTPVAINDLDTDKCHKIAKEFDLPPDLVVEDPYSVAESSLVDVFIEASSSILEGALYCKHALEFEKHLVMMNSEVDLTFGPQLLNLAKKNNLTYTSCDGDQHGVIKHLIDETKLWGFKTIMAGNIKGFLDTYANPTSIVPEADKRNLTYKMCTAYTDGTKLNIEMALVANATGLMPTKPGMVGIPMKDVHEVFKHFDFTPEMACVDYIIGAEPGGGVFVVGYNDDPYQRSMMEYYKMGKGPYYLFYRPYHLCHVESMQCIIDAAKGKSCLQPNFGFRTNVYAYAKKDLKKGEKLDGLGGYTCYGRIDKCNKVSLPICLAEGTIHKDIAKDSPIMVTDLCD